MQPETRVAGIIGQSSRQENPSVPSRENISVAIGKYFSGIANSRAAEGVYSFCLTGYVDQVHALLELQAFLEKDSRAISRSGSEGFKYVCSSAAVQQGINILINGALEGLVTELTSVGEKDISIEESMRILREYYILLARLGKDAPSDEQSVKFLEIAERRSIDYSNRREQSYDNGLPPGPAITDTMPPSYSREAELARLKSYTLEGFSMEKVPPVIDLALLSYAASWGRGSMRLLYSPEGREALAQIMKRESATNPINLGRKQQVRRLL